MVFTKKRGQAAMEFLMTYGWAILVVLVVIGALAYFGVLSPDNLLPEKCTLPIMLNCRDHVVQEKGASDKIMVNIQNGAGKDIKMKRIDFSGDGLTAICSTGALTTGEGLADNAETLRNGASSTYNATSCVLKDTGRSKNKYTVNITYSWLDSGTDHTISGELLAKTEK